MTIMSNKRKKIKVSKNRKKSWRKHCDVDEVEEFLDNNRFDERIGGSVAEKSDESLFFIEKKGSDVLLNKKLNDMKSRKVVKKEKLQEIKANIKYFNRLESDSKVKACLPKTGPKNRKRTFLTDDQKFGKVWPQKERQLLRADQELVERKQIKEDPKLRYNFYDIWDKKHECVEEDSDLKELIDYQEVLKGSKPPKVPKHRYQKPSLLPAVEVPHSGTSYNPTFEDHQNLLSIAHNIEVEKIKKENHLKRVVEDSYVTKNDAPNDRTYINEMSHGLGLSDEEDIGDDEDINTEDVLHYTKDIRRENKKTRAQRRKEMIQKKLIKEKQKEKAIKSKANEIFKLKSFKKEIALHEKESVERQKKRSQRLIEKMYKPNRLSKYGYEAPDIELNLTEELTGSLRQLKTDGNLLEDRFKSFVRRNQVENRTKQIFKRKYKLKKIAKK